MQKKKKTNPKTFPHEIIYDKSVNVRKSLCKDDDDGVLFYLHAACSASLMSQFTLKSG